MKSPLRASNSEALVGQLGNDVNVVAAWCGSGHRPSQRFPVDCRTVKAKTARPLWRECGNNRCQECSNARCRHVNAWVRFLPSQQRVIVNVQ